MKPKSLSEMSIRDLKANYEDLNYDIANGPEADRKQNEAIQEEYRKEIKKRPGGLAFLQRFQLDD